jgi:tRNA (guanine37-N1)-methyltransferase
MNLKQRLMGQIPDKDLEKIPRAFNIIGSIAVVDFPEGLEIYNEIISEEILKMQKNVKTVAKRISITSGVERIKEVEIIAGEQTTETICKENGLRLKLDINKVFFSPRLGSERLRIESQICGNETVIDMFCGIGPFSILIAKRHPDSKIYAIDINESAINYLEENMKMNKVKNIITIADDIRKAAERIGPVGDRLIMNLPRSSLEYLDLIPKLAKDNSAKARHNAVVHLYCLLKDEEIEETKDMIMRKFPKSIIIDVISCAEFGPGINIYCIDFEYRP